ncbi:hypothetical protein [Listeria grayi]|uniref:hypothetical protein n=1 Tax=Listeria grayi TaxID=1641 RepID=UPI001558F8BD|nr:hypothetical protein [Listeria grayi]
MMIADIEKETLAGLKKHSTSFSKKFSSTAKGNWVNKAKQSSTETTQLFDQL